MPQLSYKSLAYLAFKSEPCYHMGNLKTRAHTPLGRRVGRGTTAINLSPHVSDRSSEMIALFLEGCRHDSRICILYL